jgi:hypothetical protein
MIVHQRQRTESPFLSFTLLCFREAKPNTENGPGEDKNSRALGESELADKKRITWPISRES